MNVIFARAQSLCAARMKENWFWTALIMAGCCQNVSRRVKRQRDGPVHRDPPSGKVPMLLFPNALRPLRDITTAWFNPFRALSRCADFAGAMRQDAYVGRGITPISITWRGLDRSGNH
jgi:hypothetical protein